MIRIGIESFKLLLRGKAFSYNCVFDKQNIHTRIVLKDLARFCRAHTSTFHSDPRLHAVMEGRREVWLRIQEQLQLTEEEIYSMHKIKEDKGDG